MYAIVFTAEEPGEPGEYLIPLDSAETNVWRNLRNNAARGKRNYKWLHCENTDGLLTEEEEEDSDAIQELLDWIRGLCTPENKWDIASDGNVNLRDCVKISISAA